MSAADAGSPAADLPGERQITVAGQLWIVRSGGVGMAGTGRWGLAPVEAVHFFRPGATRPSYEALIGRGQWQFLFDYELAALLSTASPVPAGG